MSTRRSKAAAAKTQALDAAGAVSAFDGLENLATGQGGAKDSRAPSNRSFRYRKRLHQEMVETYRANWLAGQVVDIPAFEMTRERRDFEIKNADQVSRLEDEEVRLNLWERVRESIQWADLFGGGALLLGVANSGDWHEPLDVESVKKDTLRFLHALDARSLFPDGGIRAQLIADATSPYFMQPEFYSFAGSNLSKIHHSRIIRFPGLSLPWIEMQRTLWWGGSRVERLFDALADAEQVIGGVADLITESKIDVYKIKGLHNLLSTPKGTDTIRKRIGLGDSLKSIYQAIVMDAEEDYEQKQSQLVQGMAAIIETYLVIVSAASNIPVTRLLGTSAKGLSATGEGDLRNFYDMIDARRENYLRARLDDLDAVFVRSALGEIPSDYRWTFGSLWQMDDAQKAEIESKRASRDQILFNLGVIDEVVIAKQLKDDRTYTAIDDDYIAALEALPDPEEADPIEPGSDPDPADPAGDPKPSAE